MNRFPLLMPAIGIGVGILMARYLPLNPSWILFCLFVFFSILFIRKKVFWFFLFFIFVSLGFFWGEQEFRGHSPAPLSTLRPGITCLEGVILERPRISFKGRRQKTKFNFQAGWKEEREKIFVTLLNAPGELKKGDRVILVGKLYQWRSASNFPSSVRFNFLGIGYRTYYLIEEARSLFLWDSLREYFLRKFDDFLPDPEATLLRSILLGDRSRLSFEWKDRFSKLGIFHILSVSGFHMAAVGLFFYCVGRLCLLGPKRSFGIVLVGLVIFFFITGGRPATFRALLMAVCLISGQFFGRRGNGLNALAAAFIIALLLNPRDIFNLSFQLSYVVVFGILLSWMLLQNPARKAVTLPARLKNWFMGLFQISTTAYFFSFGLISFVFDSLPLGTILVNILLAPFFTLIILLGVLFCLFIPFGEWVGGFFSLILYLPTYLLLKILETLSLLPYFNQDGIRFSAWQVLLYYICLLGLLLVFSYRKKIRITLEKWLKPGHSREGTL